MKKRLLDYIAQTEAFISKGFSAEDGKARLSDLLVQIRFFQHERLVHLLVTFLFALLFVGSALFFYVFPELPVCLLAAAFLLLLVPYIRHYYILENGTQRLYELYDALCEKLSEIQNPGI